MSVCVEVVESGAELELFVAGLFETGEFEENEVGEEDGGFCEVEVCDVGVVRSGCVFGAGCVFGNLILVVKGCADGRYDESEKPGCGVRM